ncbi:hypothetical protein CRX72_28830 [Pantoea sp. BRM17]|nr:hypothetical protein CRX72_28830 [Pantoea sp. BRM17]
MGILVSPLLAPVIGALLTRLIGWHACFAFLLLNVRSGAMQQVMAAYLITYGGSQLIYGPLSDSVGRRPVILTGMTIFACGALIALFASSLQMLVLGSADIFAAITAGEP